MQQTAKAALRHAFIRHPRAHTVFGLIAVGAFNLVFILTVHFILTMVPLPSLKTMVIDDMD